MATNEDLSRWAAELGHDGARVLPTKSGARFVGECRCGYKTTTRTTEALAVDALIHHMYKVIRAAKSSGWVPTSSAPKTTRVVRSDTPDRVKVSRSA